VNEAPLLEVLNLVKDYPLPKQSLFAPAPQLRAVNDVSFQIAAGESFGLVGESGCGKSTLARSVMALEKPTSGRIAFQGEELFSRTADELRHLRRNFQMVFQDPYGSLDPRQPVGRIVSEPLHALAERPARPEARRLVDETLEAVGLRPADAHKYPHEFSGGQRQRIAIARALITRPALIVADEPVSALDVSVQAQVLNLLLDLQGAYRLSYLFIGHDLAVVSHIADRVAVMYRGEIVEQGPTADLFTNPQHPYTQALLEAVPRPDPVTRRARRAPLAAAALQPDSMDHRGCIYRSRCPIAEAVCEKVSPELRHMGDARLLACHVRGRGDADRRD